MLHYDTSMTDRPNHRGLRHLALHVHLFDEMKRFYVDLLGFRVEWEPDADSAYLTSGADNLALHRSLDHSSISGIKDTTLDHFGLIVLTPSDVDKWATYLKSHGVNLSNQPRAHRDGARSFYFHDPDGNQIQIIYHPPISEA